MLNYRTLAVLTATGLVALGLGASGKSASVTERIDYSVNALNTVQDPILYEELHARALQIMQERADTIKAAAAADDRCGAPQDFIGPVLCSPVVAETVPLPRPDPRKTARN